MAIQSELNGILSPGEECDDGDAGNTDGQYGTCTRACKYAAFCGDGVVNGPEECDLGSRNGLDLGKGGCTYGCTRPPYCGDGVIDLERGEQCDLGDLNGLRLDSNGQPSDAGRVYCDKECTIIGGIL
jgi:cysteine-rich repeat protein